MFSCSFDIFMLDVKASWLPLEFAINLVVLFLFAQLFNAADGTIPEVEFASCCTRNEGYFLFKLFKPQTLSKMLHICFVYFPF